MKTRHDKSNTVGKLAEVWFQQCGTGNRGAHCRIAKNSPVEQFTGLSFDSLATMIYVYHIWQPGTCSHLSAKLVVKLVKPAKRVGKGSEFSTNQH